MTHVKQGIQVIAVLTLCLCMPVLTSIGPKVIVVNPNHPLTRDSLPRVARSFSSFIANPSETPELVNETRYKSLLNGEFNQYQAANQYYDVFHRFLGTPGSDSNASQDASRHVEGSYSVRLSTNNYGNYTESMTISQTYPTNESGDTDPDQYVISNTTLGFNFYMEPYPFNQDENDSFYVQLTFNHTTPRYLRYYISGYSANTSTTQNLNVTDHNQQGAWYLFTTNVSQDYLNAGYGGSLNEVRITQVDIYLSQIAERFVASVGFIDNFTLLFGEMQRAQNGGFETVTPGTQLPAKWTCANRSPGGVTHSSFSARGGTSLNLTANVQPVTASTQTESHAMLSQNVSSYGYTMEISGNHTADLALQYYISAVPVLNTGSARMQMTFFNGSVFGTLNLYFFNNRFDLVSNTSNSIAFLLPLNTSGSWWGFQTPLLPLLYILFPGSTSNTQFLLRNVEYHITSNGTTTTTISLLLEDAGIQWTHFFDPEFENVKTSGSGIRGYYIVGNHLIASYSTNTSGSQHSANFTNPGGYTLPANYAAEIALWKEITNETIFSFEYNLDTFFGDSGNDLVAIALVWENWMNSSDQIFVLYVLATGSSMPANSSTMVSFPTGTINQTGTWLTVKRNVYRDFEAYFTTRNVGDYFINQLLVLLGSDESTDPVVLLLDNLKFGTGMPVGEGYSYQPSQPAYSEDLTLILDAFDSGSNISSACAYYNTGSGTGWQSRMMVLQDPDEQTFALTIPKAELIYGQVEFYFQLTDNAHNTNVYPQGAPSIRFSVAVDDILPPVIASIELVPEPGRANLPVLIRSRVLDAGSGVQSVIAYYSSDGGRQWHQLPLNAIGGDLYEGPAGSFPEGTVLMIYVVAIDKEGNQIESNAGGTYRYFSIGPTLTIWEMFGIGVATGAVIVGFIIFRRKRARKSRVGAEPISTIKPPPSPVAGVKSDSLPEKSP